MSLQARCAEHGLAYEPLEWACPACALEDTRPALPQPGHLLIDALMAAAEALQRLSIDQTSEQGRVAAAAYWLKGLDEHGFVVIRDPRKAAR
jgi:hypothetical protein